MNEARVVELLSQALDCTPSFDDGQYLFSMDRRLNNLELTIGSREIEALIEELDQKTVSEALWLHDNNTLEALVQDEGRFLARRIRENGIVVNDGDNNISYKIAPASDHYMLFFLDILSERPDIRFLGRLRHVGSYAINRLAEMGDDITLFDFLRFAFIRLYTITIECANRTPLSKMSQYMNSMLFQLAYNTDTALVPQRELDMLSRTARINRMRRSRSADIDPPRRIYNDALTHHYLLAVSTDNPVVEYLSHYHVLEHFYEAVFNDELISAIQDQLTQPAFSYRRKKDIKGLISKIRNSLKIRNDTITFSEDEALLLTLKKFINLNEIADDLDNYDSDILAYFRSNKVPFSGGPKVHLRSEDIEESYIHLAKRIYQTRNALVHSKDGDKSKYTPFTDDHALLKELPLLRFVAERTIVEDSKLID